MPTDTTIIDRLRGLAEMMGTDGDAEAEASAIVLAAADALTAAHAARDAAEREITDRIAQAVVDGTRASIRVNGLDDAIKLVRDVADGGRSWRDTAAREHAALTTALRERDEARAALEAARYSCDHEGVCLLIDTKPDGTR